MLVATNSITVNKKYSMRVKMDTVVQHFDYATTHLDTEITFHCSNMILKINTDTSYLSEFSARISVGRHLFMVKRIMKTVISMNQLPLNVPYCKKLSDQRQKVNWEAFSIM